MARVPKVLSALALVGVLAAAGCGSDNSSGGGGGGGGGGGVSSSSSSSTTSGGSTAANPGHEGPFRILSIASQTGPLGIFGASEVQGMKAAVNVLNAQGGINGHKIEYEVKDNGSDPAKAVTLLQQALTGSKKPDMVFAGINGAEGLAITPVTNQNKILSWQAAPAAKLGDPKQSPYTFITNPAYASIGSAGADELYKRGARKVVTVSSDDEPGHDNVAGFKAQFEKLGGKVIGSEYFAPTSLDLTGVWERVYSKNPDGTYMVNEGTQVQELKGRQAAGGTKVDNQCDSGCVNDPRKLGVSAAALANSYGLGPSLVATQPADRTPRQAEYIKALDAVGGDKGVGLIIPALTYDAIMLTAQAAKQANSIDSVEITKALENLQGDPQWALGFKYHYTPDSHFSAQPGDPSPFVTFPQSSEYKDGYFIVKDSAQ